MKKNLIIVESLTNLFIAINIRNMYSGERFDIVVPSNRESLRSIYKSGRLKKVFDNIYLANYDAIDRFFRKLEVVIDIRLAIYQYLGKDFLDDYTDLFFWNPSNFLFVLYAFLNRNNNINTHVYADAFGGYIVDSPDSPISDDDIFRNPYYPHFKMGIWDRLFKLKYNTPYVRDMGFDFYMFKPELSFIKRTHNTVEVPYKTIIDNLDLINHIYDYDPEYKFNGKWIVLSNVLGERREALKDLYVIQTIADTIPPKDIVIKPHPRCNRQLLEHLGIEIIKKQFTMELFFLNNNLEDYVFISDESSAILLSTLVFEKRIKVIWLRELFDGFKIYNNEVWRIYIDMMREKGCTCYEPQNMTELQDILGRLNSEDRQG